MVNVCINPEHKITKVVAGSLQAYGELAQYQETLCFFSLKEPYDVVISGNGGYPLDLNLYQAVKSMAIGERGVRKGRNYSMGCMGGKARNMFCSTKSILSSKLQPQPDSVGAVIIVYLELSPGYGASTGKL